MSSCAYIAASTTTGSVSYPGDGDIITYGASMNFLVTWDISSNGQVSIWLYKENTYVKSLGSWLIDDGNQSVPISSSDVTQGSCYHIVIATSYTSAPNSLPSSGDSYIVGSYFTIE